MYLKPCNSINQPQHLHSIAFGIKGLNKLRAASLKEHSAILGFNKKI